MDLEEEWFCARLRLNGNFYVTHQSAMAQALCREALYRLLRNDHAAVSARAEDLEGQGPADDDQGEPSKTDFDPKKKPLDVKTEPVMERSLTKDEENQLYNRVIRAQDNASGTLGSSAYSDHRRAMEEAEAAKAAAGALKSAMKRRNVDNDNKPETKKVKKEIFKWK